MGLKMRSRKIRSTDKEVTNQVNKQNEMTKANLMQENDFLQTMKSLVSFSRVFGIPIAGGRLMLGWFAVVFSMHVAIELGTLWKLVKLLAGKTAFSTGNRSIIARISGSIFYGNAVLSLFLFLRLRSSWKRIADEWLVADSTIGLHFPQEKYLKPKLWMVIGIVFVFSCVEHIMSMVAVGNLDYEFMDYVRHYVLSSHAFLIIPSDYSTPFGIAIFILGKTGTVFWNFQDLFIILISIGLSSRYRRLNKHVENLIAQDITATKIETDGYIRKQIWQKTREAYVKQAALVRNVDKQLGWLILLSNANNFYFICLQVFNGVGGLDISVYNRIYYFTSISWLCTRACSVVLFAADININSKAALKFMHRCPDRSYNVEVQRLEAQLSKDYVALSGVGFFYLDRRTLIDVVAAIFKYELVLLEFDKD